MYKLGDTVWFENYNVDDDEVDLVEAKIVDTNEHKEKYRSNIYYRTDKSRGWFAESELFLTKKELARSLMEQIKEDEKELFEEIKALEEDIKTSKKHLKDMDRKYSTLSLIKD